jgi:hypothetical protein
MIEGNLGEKTADSMAEHKVGSGRDGSEERDDRKDTTGRTRQRPE